MLYIVLNIFLIFFKCCFCFMYIDIIIGYMGYGSRYSAIYDSGGYITFI